MKIKLLSIPINLFSALIIVFFHLVSSDWFGSSDVFPYLFWTLGLTISIATFGDALLQIVKCKKGILRSSLLIILAGFLAFSWVFIVFLFLGPWMNAFSLPVFYLWWAGIFTQLSFIDFYFKPKQPGYKPYSFLTGLVGYYLLTIFSTFCLLLLLLALAPLW